VRRLPALQRPQQWGVGFVTGRGKHGVEGRQETRRASLRMWSTDQGFIIAYAA
jgi:hypothetical protein